MQKLFRGVNVTSRAVSISKEMKKVIRAGVGGGDWMVESRSETENSRNTVRKYFLGGVIEFPPLFPYEWSPPREKRVAESSRKTARESRAVRNVKIEFKGGYLCIAGGNPIVSGTKNFQPLSRSPSCFFFNLFIP